MSCCRSSAMDWRTHDAECKYDECDMRHAPSMPCAKCEARIAAKTAADHGISPAQLREKVEALEQVVVDCIKRIEELERWTHSHTSMGHVDLTVHKTLKDKP